MSRWETGAGRASFHTLRRYEELLGLPAGLLVATADTIYRYAAPPAAGAPTLARGPAVRPGSPEHARLEQLLERAVSAEEMSGWDWDELTGQLSTLPTLVVVPSRLWMDMASGLLEEMVVADGLAWMQRFEALNRLLGHPIAERSAIAACMSFADDPANHEFVEPVSALDASAHPDAGRHVLHHLTRPINERARYGALLACIRKVRYGHFTPDQMDGLVSVVAEMLGEPDSHADAGALGVEVLRRMPPAYHASVDPRLRRALAGDRTLHEVLAAGRLAASATSKVVVDRIVRAAETDVSREAPGFTDELLPVLVDEILYAPVLDVRLYTSMLIRATPYAGPVAAAFAAELTRRHALADTTLSASLLGGLRNIGAAEQRPLVERFVLANGLPGEVSAAAVESIAHVGGVSSDRFWLSAIARHGRTWRRHRARPSAAALKGLVYGLGIARNLKLLGQVRNDEEAPGPVRAAASWWLARPARVYASVRS